MNRQKMKLYLIIVIQRELKIAFISPLLFFRSRARRTIENAFGRLKGRWRRLLKDAMEVKLEDASKIVAVCCALHNLCEDMRDPFMTEWNTTNQRMTTRSRSHADTDEATLIRNALKNHFVSQSSY